MNKQLILCFLLLTIIELSTATPVIIYDNITASQYSTITINDDLNYKLITDYKYDVSIDGKSIGKYGKDEPMYVPDNSTVLIYVPAPVSLDYGTSWDLGKVYFAIAIMFLLTIGLGIFVVFYFYRKAKGG